ncbi:MAG: arginine--tRNA ligase, partial [Candidatus Omnitrophota bacterium]
MQTNIQDSLIVLIKEALVKLGFSQDSSLDLFLDFPTDSRFGELTTNIALRLAKQAKKPPQQVAQDLVAALNVLLENSPLKAYIQQVKVEGAGFVNFYFSSQYFYQQLAAILKDGEGFFKDNSGQGKRVLLEFVSANPTGPLSVAHARQAAVGDALSRVMSFLGFVVEKEYYLNDEGNQINILGRSVQLRLQELKGEKAEFPEDHYQGEYIYDIAKEAAKLPDQQAATLAEFAVKYILDIIKKELDDFGVKFDSWYSQKELSKSGKIDIALAALRDLGFLYDEDGAAWFKSTGFGDDKDRVVIKSGGSYTYLAPDIAYHQDKYARGFSWLINLWGPDHHGYISRLKASVAAFGQGPQSLSVIIVQLATIFRGGKPLQMSTRRGQYITLREVLDEVGLDGARFFFLMRRTSSHLDFDLEVAKKQTPENPVYYVQYAHARIANIIKNSQLNP